MEVIDKSDTVNDMLYAMMKIDEEGYYSLIELKNFIYLFPFSYTVSKEALVMDERFDLSLYNTTRPDGRGIRPGITKKMRIIRE